MEEEAAGFEADVEADEADVEADEAIVEADEADEQNRRVNQGSTVVTLREVQGSKVGGKNYATNEDFLYHKDRAG